MHYFVLILFNAGDVKSGAGKTFKVDALAGGPAFLGCTGMRDVPEGSADDLHCFIAKYVFPTQGTQKIKNG